MTVITATFVKTRIQDSGSDSVMDYHVYDFSNIVDSDGNLYPDKWIKATELLKKVSFSKGKKYVITLSRDIPKTSINMPFPICIKDGKVEYHKTGGRIKQKTADGKTITLTEINKREVGDETPAIEKLMRGKMEGDYLLRKNKKGIYFSVSYKYPEKTRRGNSPIYSFSKTNENLLTIQKASQKEIDEDIDHFKMSNRYSIIQHFTIVRTLIKQDKK